MKKKGRYLEEKTPFFLDLEVTNYGSMENLGAREVLDKAVRVEDQEIWPAAL